jgi:hypothetical protein
MRFTPGSRLLSKITPLEIKRGIFIAGHRFEPYRDPGIAPWEIALAPQNGTAFSSRSIPFSVKDTAIYFTFFGQAVMLSLLIEQEPSNAKALSSAGASDALVRLKAFDMEAFYAESGLAVGDYLDLELVDHEGSRFLVRPLKAASIAPERRKAWYAAIGEGVEIAMRNLGRPVDPPSFIEATFEAAPAWVREEPAAAFSEYFNESKAVQVKEFGGQVFMWGSGASIPELLMSGDSPGRPRNDADDDEEDELSLHLADLGFSLDTDEIAAFVRDALWRGEGIEEALGRCFIGAAEIGLSKRKLDTLLVEVRAFAQGVAAAWDRSAEHPAAARMRSALLDIYSPFLFWMRRLGALVSSPSDLDTEEFSLLSTTMQGICELIVNLGEGQVSEPGDLAEFEEQLATLGEMISELMAGIEGTLAGNSRRRRSSASGTRGGGKTPGKARRPKGKRAARPSSRKLYTFEARIADIEPPIRRRLVVPGNRSLAELHTILQDAFGWTDSHLHLFRIRDETFGLPSPENDEPLIDERNIRLDELSLRVRSKIEYVYDYGDDWAHELVVVAARNAAPGEDEEAPICSEAERASPPEDCGGFPGYMDLLEALAKPEEERDEDESSLVEWAEGWDAESCDLAEINKALERD